MKVYLAGYETQYRYIKQGLPGANFFCTAAAATGTRKALDEVRNSPEKYGAMTVDSGAFTYMNAAGLFEGKKASGIDRNAFDLLFKKYVTLIKEKWDQIDHFIELDIQKLVGIEKVYEYRQMFKAEGLTSKMLYVLHSSDQKKDWDWALQKTECKYVCFESIRRGMPVLPYKDLLSQCIREKIRVHALALTRPDFCKTYPFYSVDSSSWVGILRYGRLCLWDDLRGEFTTMECSPTLLKKYDLPPDLLSSRRQAEYVPQKLRFSGLQYMRMEKYLTELWRSRGITWEDAHGSKKTKVS